MVCSMRAARLPDTAAVPQVRTGIVDEKAAALQALGLYAAHTGPAFLPFAEKALQLCKEMAGTAPHHPSSARPNCCGRVCPELPFAS